MNREQVEVLVDTSQLLHLTTSVGGVVTREIIEVFTGEWSTEAMTYLANEGARITAGGFQLVTSNGFAERWTRYEFWIKDHP